MFLIKKVNEVEKIWYLYDRFFFQNFTTGYVNNVNSFRFFQVTFKIPSFSRLFTFFSQILGFYA